jgi:phosphoribosylformylglycinamidine cyclo-ligase
MAEMPGLYSPGEFDLAGFCVGLAERNRLIDGSTVQEGDAVLGLASSGLHSNGYSLVRKVLEVNRLDLDGRFPNQSGDGGETIADALLRPTRIYVKSVLRLLAEGVPVRAMAHITGGGMIGNLARVIPDGLSARLHFKHWSVPAPFSAIQRLGNIQDEEMFSTFNMGVGYVLVVPGDSLARARALLAQGGEEVMELGEIARGLTKVTLGERQ